MFPPAVLWLEDGSTPNAYYVYEIQSGTGSAYLRSLFSHVVDGHFMSLERIRTSTEDAAVRSAELSRVLGLVHDEIGRVLLPSHAPNINFDIDVWPTVESRVRAKHEAPLQGGGGGSVGSGAFASSSKRRRLGAENPDERVTSYLVRSRMFDHSDRGLWCEYEQAVEHCLRFFRIDNPFQFVHRYGTTPTKLENFELATNQPIPFGSGVAVANTPSGKAVLSKNPVAGMNSTVQLTMPGSLLQIFSGYLNSDGNVMYPDAGAVTAATGVLCDVPSGACEIPSDDAEIVRLHPCEREDVDCDGIWDFGSFDGRHWTIGSGPCLASDGYDAACAVVRLSKPGGPA